MSPYAEFDRNLSLVLHEDRSPKKNTFRGSMRLKINIPAKNSTTHTFSLSCNLVKKSIWNCCFFSNFMFFRCPESEMKLVLDRCLNDCHMYSALLHNRMHRFVQNHSSGNVTVFTRLYLLVGRFFRNLILKWDQIQWMPKILPALSRSPETKKESTETDRYPKNVTSVDVNRKVTIKPLSKQLTTPKLGSASDFKRAVIISHVWLNRHER